jgi:hypothetical protein
MNTPGNWIVSTVFDHGGDGRAANEFLTVAVAEVGSRGENELDVFGRLQIQDTAPSASAPAMNKCLPLPPMGEGHFEGLFERRHIVYRRLGSYARPPTIHAIGAPVGATSLEAASSPCCGSWTADIVVHRSHPLPACNGNAGSAELSRFVSTNSRGHSAYPADVKIVRSALERSSPERTGFSDRPGRPPSGSRRSARPGLENVDALRESLVRGRGRLGQARARSLEHATTHRRGTSPCVPLGAAP